MRHNAQRACFPGPAGWGSRCELLMWHGRLDNRSDLVRQLGGSAAGPSSDGSLVRTTYERWGIAGLGRVIGDWCAVLCDPRHRAIVLASDFSGVRPLYYHHRGHEVLWSRSLEALLDHVDASALDEQYIAGYLTIGGYPSRTPYAGVHAVMPGYAARVTVDGAALSAFWRPPTSDGGRCHDEREYEEQFRALFRHAVSCRLQATAPVAAELSGCLDSSSVVCVAADLIRRGDVAASGLMPVSYVHRGSRDVPFIRKVEEHLPPPKRASLGRRHSAVRGTGHPRGASPQSVPTPAVGRSRRPAGGGDDLSHRPGGRPARGQLARRQPADRAPVASWTPPEGFPRRPRLEPRGRGPPPRGSYLGPLGRPSRTSAVPPRCTRLKA